MNPKRNDHSKNETDEASVVSSWRRKRIDSKRRYVDSDGIRYSKYAEMPGATGKLI